MSNRLLLVLCGVFGLLTGIVALSPLTAEDQAAQSPAAAESYLLAYKYQSGDVVRYETVQKGKFISQFQGTADTATNETQTRKAFRVLKVNADGSADLELVIEWVKMIADFGGGGVPTEFDSSDPAAKSQVKFRDVLRNVGKPQARLVVTPSGKVVKVQEMSIVTPGPVGAQSIQLKNMAGRDDFSFLTVFPETPVKVGESWSEDSKIQVTVEDNLKKTIQARRKYTLDKVEGNRATISFRTVIRDPVRDNNIAIQLIQRETSGELIFDIKQGSVLTRTVDHDKSIINPAGSNTAMHSKSHLLERLMTEAATISDVDNGAVKK